MWFVVCFHPFPHHMQHGLPHTSALRLAHFACPFSANLQQAGPHNSETNIFRWSKSNGKGSLQPIDWWISCLPSDSTLHRSKQVQFGKTSWRSHGSYLLFGSILSLPKRRASKLQHHKKNNLWLETPLRKSSTMGPPTKPFFYFFFFFFRLVIGDFFLQGRVWCNSPDPIHPLGVVGCLLFGTGNSTTDLSPVFLHPTCRRCGETSQIHTECLPFFEASASTCHKHQFRSEMPQH